MNNMKMSVQAICNSLEKIPTDGSSWLIPNWKYDYRNMKHDLIFGLKYDVTKNLYDFTDDIDALREWRDATPSWEKIIENNDVAMYPPCLKEFKSFYMRHMDMDCCETINLLSWNAVHSDYTTYFHNRLYDFYGEWGVYKFRCIIGDNMFKLLRKHLNVTVDEFQSVYGVGLFYDVDCCDEMLIEMFVTGRLTGGVRNYKIEKDYACFF